MQWGRLDVEAGMAVILFARFSTVGMQKISGGGGPGKVTTAGVDISMDAIAEVGITIAGFGPIIAGDGIIIVGVGGAIDVIAWVDTTIAGAGITLAGVDAIPSEVRDGLLRRLFGLRIPPALFLNSVSGVDMAGAGVGNAGSWQVELSGVVCGLSDKEQLRLRLKILFRESPLYRVRCRCKHPESWDNVERVDLGESREFVRLGSSEKSSESDDHDVFEWLRFRVGVDIVDVDMGESYPSTVVSVDNVGAEVGVLGAVMGADSLNLEVIEVGICESFGSTTLRLRLTSLGPVHFLCFTSLTRDLASIETGPGSRAVIILAVLNCCLFRLINSLWRAILDFPPGLPSRCPYVA